MINLLIDKLYYWHSHPLEAPRVAVISGTGEKAFCAGGDIKRLYDASVGKEKEEVKSEFFAREYLADYALT
jgi:enoyl-CoA hydratase/carnithine racemase